MTTADAGTSAFAEHRDHVFGVAYRMLGSVAEAEDVVQEAYLRWSAADPATVRSPVAFLTTVATRLAIDRLRSAQRRRERYVGPWLPEPLVAEGGGSPADDPAEAAELADSLTTAFLVLLERLNPLERAVLLLHDVFGYPFSTVAEVVDRPAASCRQAASRARAKLEPGRHPLPVGGVAPDDEQRLVTAFGAAAALGDLSALESVLTEDVLLWSDGGADRHAARRPVVGPERVARFLVSVTKRLPAGADVVAARVNGEPGLVVRTADGPYLTLAVEASPTGVRTIHVVLNPDKLRHLV